MIFSYYWLKFNIIDKFFSNISFSSIYSRETNTSKLLIFDNTCYQHENLKFVDEIRYEWLNHKFENIKYNYLTKFQIETTNLTLRLSRLRRFFAFFLRFSFICRFVYYFLLATLFIECIKLINDVDRDDKRINSRIYYIIATLFNNLFLCYLTQKSQLYINYNQFKWMRFQTIKKFKQIKVYWFKYDCDFDKKKY